MTEHDHREFVPGCFRCDLGRDEAKDASRPLALIDVDGVLFPFGNPTMDLEHDGWRLRRCGPVEWVPFNPEMSRRLAWLERDFDCVWATARYDDVLTTVAKLMDVGQNWPVIAFDGQVMRQGSRIAVVGIEAGTTWKLPAVAAFAEAEDRPLVWIDDHLADDARTWAKERELPTLAYRIRPDVGLTDRDVDEVLRWKRVLGL